MGIYKADWELYKAQIMRGIKVHKMSLMSDEALLIWVEKKLAEYPEEKEKKS